MPTVDPTSQPSSRPSSLPSSYPSSSPTSQPSAMPTVDPTSQPSSRPSRLPSSQPSRQPSRQPSSQPTKQPSSQPSRQPSTVPTSVPTSSPTESDDTLWKRRLINYNTQIEKEGGSSKYSIYYQELRTRGSYLFGGCKSYTVFTTSVLFYSFFTEHINALTIGDLDSDIRTPNANVSHVTCRDRATVKQIAEALSSGGISTTEEFGCNNNAWRVRTCAATKTTAICVNCTDPCDSDNICTYPVNSFTLNPCGMQSKSDACVGQWGAGHLRSLLVETSPLEPAPSLNYKSQNITKSSIELLIELGGNGTVYCGLFPSAYVPSSEEEIILKNVVGEKVTAETIQRFSTVGWINSQYSRTIKFDSVVPSTNYSVYCFTRGLYGTKMPYSNVTKTKYLIKTPCCKDLSVDIFAKSLLATKDSLNSVQFSLSAAPNKAMKILLQTSCGENQEKFCDMVPSEVQIDSSSSNVITASIQKTSTEFRGEISILATLSGESASEYAVVYKNGKSTVNVIGSDVSPPAPAMSSAYFSNDGRARVCGI